MSRSALGGIVTALRAVRSRAGASFLVAFVAVVAVAGGTAGPTYYLAGQTSVLRDTVASEAVLGRGYEVTETGSVSRSFAGIDSDVSADLGNATSLFSSPVRARQAEAFYLPSSENLLLASSSGLCSHLHIEGSCPDRSGQILISQGLAALNHWHSGQTVDLSPWGPLGISGIYRPPALPDDYWFDQMGTYFPVEYGASPSTPGSRSLLYDAVFATQSTLLDAPPTSQGTLVYNAVARAGSLRTGDVAKLSDRLSALMQDPSLQAEQAIVTTSIPATMTKVRSGWTALAVPVVVVTLELLSLAALLLWILVTDATAARGSEIALAKLRGHGRVRVAVFALAEPVILLVGAVPIGVLLGWAATEAIGAGLLRPGTPIGLPPLGWAAGAAAALGGVVAVAVAARPTVRRPVMEQWRRADRRPARPAWTLDAVLLTGAAAGVAEVVASGSISSSHQHPLALALPGLIALAVAVVAARLLPAACSFAGRLRLGGPASFLALRQLSRRAGAMRTTTVLATGFALATFAVSAWALTQANYRTVAAAEVGAPTVLEVTAPPGADLRSLVRQADPTGEFATPVEEYFSNDTTTLAVDPQQWGRVALHISSGPTASQLAELSPAEAPELILNGTSVRLDLQVHELSPAGTVLVLDVLSPGGAHPTPVEFPTLPGGGPARLTAALPPCPCLVEGLTAEPPPAQFEKSQLHGSISVTGLATSPAPPGSAVSGAYLDAGRWYDPAGSTDAVTPTDAGFNWRFQAANGSATLSYRDRPFPLPAIAAAGVTARTGPFNTTGLDGTTLAVNVVRTVPTTPGAPGTGVIVDLQYAELAAEGNLTAAQQQVWISGHQSVIEKRLEHEGVSINRVSTSAAATALLRRSGPGLADALFLAEAAAAAVLAAGTAVAALYLLGRRRRYELAALLTVGVSTRKLIRSVLVEQLLLATYGAVIGVAAGLISAATLLADVPEFAAAPTGVPLSSFPAPGSIAPLLVMAFALVLAAAVAASIRLVAGVELTQLREAPG